MDDKRDEISANILPTARVKILIELAFKLCAERGDPRVGTGHLLLALVTEAHGIGAQVLKNLGASREGIAAEMAQLSDPEA
jgi:ATP-dependent Clp protease ATP-binding subunit ClpA